MRDSDHDHIADRPSWGCATCGQPWPCEPAQQRLTTENSPTQVAMLMWVAMESAAFDLRNMPVGTMFERFLRWTWPMPG